MLDRLFPTSAENRAINFQSIWGAGDSYAVSTNSGTVVTQENAMKIATVYACVRLISDSISTLPVGVSVESMVSVCLCSHGLFGSITLNQG